MTCVSCSNLLQPSGIGRHLPCTCSECDSWPRQKLQFVESCAPEGKGPGNFDTISSKTGEAETARRPELDRYEAATVSSECCRKNSPLPHLQTAASGLVRRLGVGQRTGASRPRQSECSRVLFRLLYECRGHQTG